MATQWQEPVQGTWETGGVFRICVGLILAMTIVAGIAPAAGHLNYLLEVIPGLLMVGTFVALYRRFPFSNIIYINAVLHCIILTYGGFYTYADTPLGNWAKVAFDLSRNHYDRIGHLALGFFPVLIIREVMLRKTPLELGGWLTFITLNIVLSIGAFWELVEWWTTLLVAGDVGDAFLGSQGDVWDAQWDMFLAVVGAVLSLLVLRRLHDRSMGTRFASPEVQP